MLINKLNNKGLGRKETMMALLLILIIMAVVLYKVLGTNDTTQFTNFRRLANTFINEAGMVRDVEIGYEEQVFLYDTINLSYSEELKSPFNQNDKCDIYESKIKMVNKSVYVTLKCSDYIIYNQLTTENEYKIYKVSEWTDEKLTGSNVQEATFYNYEVNGEEQLPTYYMEKEFLVKYAEKTGYKTNYVSYLRSEHKLLEKTYYRTIEEVE